MKTFRRIATLTVAAAIMLTTAACGTDQPVDVPARDLHPTTAPPDPDFEAEVRAEIAAMVPKELDPNNRELFDSDPHDVALNYFKSILDFDLADDTLADIEQRGEQWFTGELILPNGQLPTELSNAEQWEELANEHAVVSLGEVFNITPLESDGALENEFRYSVNYTVTRESEEPSTHEATYFVALSRTADKIWRISDVGEM